LGKAPFVFSANAWYKSYQVRRDYLRTVDHYQRKKLVDWQPELFKAPQSRRLKFLASKEHLARLFFLGTDEQQDKSGALQALGRLGEVHWFTRADGGYGQNYPGSEPDRRHTNSVRILELFEELSVRETVPDLLIAQTWAGYVDPKVLGHIRETYGTLIINIGMDDRHQYWGRKVHGEWWGTRGLIPHLDLALTAAPECVEWYEKEGCPALFFPEASDPDIFRPIPESPKLHDVCFVGGCYGIREKIVRALREAGIQVTAYGSGWGQGRLDTEEVPRLFAQSKIVLGVGTIGHCEDFYALKMRDFDGPMSGSCYVTHDNPDLRLVYKVGEEIVTYRSVSECVDKVRWYLSHEDERELVARAGRARALADHTWEKRFKGLFDVLRTGLNSSGHGFRVQ
jgi:glycosyltransferase involved in cell wall biosynthesis